MVAQVRDLKTFTWVIITNDFNFSRDYYGISNLVNKNDCAFTSMTVYIGNNSGNIKLLLLKEGKKSFFLGFYDGKIRFTLIYNNYER